MRFTVTPATPDDFTSACRVLNAHRPQPGRDLAALRFRDMLTSGELDPAGLFVAKDEGGRVRGAALVQPLPGALGLAWPARAERGRDRAAVEDALTAAACDWLRSRGVKVCQSFASARDRSDVTSLERGGFRNITHVVHMRRPLDRDRDTPSDGTGVFSFEPFSPANRDAFTASLLATYTDSRDCPELTGTRTAEELLDGFRGALAVRPDWWYLVRRGGEPVGVVLFDAGTEPGVLELNYLGLVPAARGRGWAGELVRFAVGFAAADDNTALNLSVDARNEPALRLYDRYGFRESERRGVYLAAWPGPDEVPASGGRQPPESD